VMVMVVMVLRGPWAIIFGTAAPIRYVNSYPRQPLL
jgi:hypothetical protein